MNLTYNDAIKWIQSRLQFGIKPGLHRMKKMMEKLDHPEKELKVIHVGGTNGKGSTVTYIRSMLTEAGYHVGTFTSPAIEQFNERISIDGEPIKDNEIVQLVQVMQPIVKEMEELEEGSPTEFEVITAMAIYYFARIQPVDLVIFEVGLGGKQDSTNILTPIVSIITNIGLDHTHILGSSLAEIASEKAGIMKRHVPVITAVKQHEANEIIQEKAREMEAVIYSMNEQFQVFHDFSIARGERFSFQSIFGEIQNLELLMLGAHQVENAGVAVMTILYLQKYHRFQISEKELRSGLKKAYWPARMELLQYHPPIIIDGAHNPEGMRALVKTLQKRYPSRSLKIVFSALRDKELSHILSILESLDSELYFTEFDVPRAASASELLEASPHRQATVVPDWQKLLRHLSVSLKDEEVLVVTGSLYFLSAMKPFLVDLIEGQD